MLGVKYHSRSSLFESCSMVISFGQLKLVKIHLKFFSRSKGDPKLVQTLIETLANDQRVKSSFFWFKASSLCNPDCKRGSFKNLLELPRTMSKELIAITTLY